MSLLIDADGEKLIGVFGSPIWTVASEFTIAARVKIIGAGWGEAFGLYDNANSTYNNATLRTAAGTSYDHNLVLKGGDRRMDGSGSVSGGFDLLVLTYKQNVGKIAYLNNVAARTDTTNVADPWEWGVGADTVAFGGLVGRMKISHCGVWDIAMSAAEVAQMYNGGTAGAGKDPQTIQPAHLKFYRALISDLSGGVGSPTFSTIGSPTFDAADNPNVESSGGSGTSVAVTGQAYTYSSGTVTSSASRSVALSGQSYSYAQGAPSVALPAGTINIPPVIDWETELPKLSATFQADIYNRTTRGLIVSKPGLTTHATTGAGSVTDAALTAGTTYRVVTEFSDGSLGIWDYTAT